MGSQNNLDINMINNWFSKLTEDGQRQMMLNWGIPIQSSVAGTKRVRLDVPLAVPDSELAFTTTVNEKEYVPTPQNTELTKNGVMKQFPPIYVQNGASMVQNNATPMFNPAHVAIPTNMPDLTHDASHLVYMKSQKAANEQLRLNEKTLMEQNVGLGNARKNLGEHALTAEASSKALETGAEGDCILGL